MGPDFAGRLPGAFLVAGTSSFADFLANAAPGLVPGGPAVPVAESAGAGGHTSPAGDLTHGTTIVAAACDGGVIMAGDRRATAGNVIAQRDFNKVFRTDEFSAVGIAGVAGVGTEMARVFQVELEHYEKMEGHPLSLDGKANRLAGFVRANIGAAMQGLVAVPLFAGYDEDQGIGRIFSYDVTGGSYEEHRFYVVGSGSPYARGALKKLYRDGMSPSDAILACMQALYDAADDDSATGGPDVARRIYPVIATITADGFERLTDEAAGQYAQTVIEGRLTQPDGPLALLQRGGSSDASSALPPG